MKLTKQCPSFEGYSATEEGNIISHHRKGVKLNGVRGGTQLCIDYNHSNILNGSLHKKGYIMVSVRVNGKCRPVGAHQLVADAFYGPCPQRQQVRHLDGNPQNNHYKNLAYGTIFQNNQDRKVHGTYKNGGKHHGAKLTDDQANEIRLLRRLRVKVKELAAKYGVSVSVIESIIYGKAYKILSTTGKPDLNNQ